MRIETWDLRDGFCGHKKDLKELEAITNNPLPNETEMRQGDISPVSFVA